eukprot:m.151926 g.151926  ORF g.151926 m.151926 type:complete len:378 (-) comp17427_c0_seq1:443-1576(-)
MGDKLRYRGPFVGVGFDEKENLVFELGDIYHINGLIGMTTAPAITAKARPLGPIVIATDSPDRDQATRAMDLLGRGCRVDVVNIGTPGTWKALKKEINSDARLNPEAPTMIVRLKSPPKKPILTGEFLNKAVHFKHPGEATFAIARLFQYATINPGIVTSDTLHGAVATDALGHLTGKDHAAVNAYLNRQHLPDGNKYLVWIRNGAREASRDTTQEYLNAMLAAVALQGGVPLLIGQRNGALNINDTNCSLLEFFTDKAFLVNNGFARQLYMFQQLMTCYGVVGQLGVKSGGMDGPALLGLPTITIDVEHAVGEVTRMASWGRYMPGYRTVYNYRHKWSALKEYKRAGAGAGAAATTTTTTTTTTATSTTVIHLTLA